MNIFHTYSMKSLKKNKTRTIVTIIGIILSVAMITAVTTMIASVQQYGIDYVTQIDGDWHVFAGAVDAQKRESFYADDRVAKTYELRNVGYAYLEDCVNDYKPFLCVQAMNKDFKNNMPIQLTDGRLPDNDREILIPKHMYTNGGVELKIGDTLNLDIGYRSLDGKMLWQSDSLSVITDEGDTIECIEQFTSQYKRTYTVVGFYERPSFEEYSAPGYTALTVQGEDFGYPYYDCYVVMKHPNTAFDLWNEISEEEMYHTKCNNGLLRFYGLSTRDDFNAVLYGMGSILIGIIVLGSVALIYNAFAISISERTKQFGLLTSIGATKKQMKQSICFEALILCVAGIPFGVLSGIAGIGITLICLKSPLQNFMGNIYEGGEMKLHVSVASVVIAVIISIITVLISAYLPMRRALKVSAIDAIKQRNDIKLNAKNVRIPGFVSSLFGVEGTIAYKNYKRNKKQYRATVISLAMSIILFVTAGSFSTYLFGSYADNVTMHTYDIQVSYGAKSYAEIADIYDKVCDVEGIMPYYSYGNIEGAVAVAETDLTNEALQKLDGNKIFSVEYGFLSDEEYSKMVEMYELDAEKYQDLKNVPAIVINSARYWDDDGETEHFLMLRENCKQLYNVWTGHDDETDISLYEGDEVRQKADGMILVGEKNMNTESKEIEIPIEKRLLSTILVGDIVEDTSFEDMPEGKIFYVGSGTSEYNVRLIYPLSMLDTLLSQMNLEQYNLRVEMNFVAEDHKKAYDTISILLQDYENVYVNDLAESEEQERGMLIMLQVFSFGFIILISLISAANVFNTISTNMNLRRREFAMLKSFGMSEKGFVKMMNFECILYGVKGLFYGLCIAIILVIWMYYKSMGDTLSGFYLPWQYIIISAISVFAVVYSTMIYGRLKLKKENIVDALKNENQ